MFNILYALICIWNDKFQNLVSDFLSVFDMLVDQLKTIPTLNYLGQALRIFLHCHLQKIMTSKNWL